MNALFLILIYTNSLKIAIKPANLNDTGMCHLMTYIFLKIMLKIYENNHLLISPRRKLRERKAKECRCKLSPETLHPCKCGQSSSHYLGVMEDVKSWILGRQDSENSGPIAGHSVQWVGHECVDQYLKVSKNKMDKSWCVQAGVTAGL